MAHRIDRVPTKANLSDPISRFEGLPHGLLWSHIQLPQKAIAERCLKVIGDIQVASCLGFENIPGLENVHSCFSL